MFFNRLMLTTEGVRRMNFYWFPDQAVFPEINETYRLSPGGSRTLNEERRKNITQRYGQKGCRSSSERSREQAVQSVSKLQKLILLLAIDFKSTNCRNITV
jgi:hypothetical protein